MNYEDIVRLAWRHCPGGHAGRAALSIFFFSLYVYVISFMFMVAVMIASLATLCLSAKVSWISANSFSRYFSGRERSSGEIPGFRLYAGAIVIFLIFCDFLLLLRMFSTAHLESGTPAQSMTWIVLATVGKAIALPWIFVQHRRRGIGADASAEPDFRSYLENRAVQDLRYALLDAWQRTTDFTVSAYRKLVDTFFRGRKRWLLWPLGLIGVLTLTAPVIFSAILLATVFLLHGSTIMLLRVFGTVVAPAWAQIRNRSTGTRLP